MALSQVTLMARVRRIVGDNPFYDTCTEAMDATETGLDVADTTKYDVGSIVEFQDDGEQCLVTALAGGTTLTVVRNYGYSVTTTAGTGTSHSINAQIAVDPAVSYSQIVDSIGATLRGLYPYVYKLVSYTLTPVSGTKWYELDDGGDTCTCVELSSVQQVIPSGSTNKLFYYGVADRAYPADIHFQVPTSFMGSGVALYVPYLRDTTNSIIVRGIARLTATVSGGNYSDISDGLEADAVAYLAVARLVAEAEVPLILAKDVSMGDVTVRPSTRTQLATYWERRGIEERRKWEQLLQRTLPRRGLHSFDKLVTRKTV